MQPLRFSVLLRTADCTTLQESLSSEANGGILRAALISDKLADAQSMPIFKTGCATLLEVLQAPQRHFTGKRPTMVSHMQPLRFSLRGLARAGCAALLEVGKMQRRRFSGKRLTIMLPVVCAACCASILEAACPALLQHGASMTIARLCVKLALSQNLLQFQFSVLPNMGFVRSFLRRLQLRILLDLLLNSPNQACL